MDQVKIGKFIAQCRKDRGMTQMQLAEKLGITDRAVSKWETGKSMPDVAIITDLCRELGISLNDLLSGEIVSSEQYSQKLEVQLLDMMGQKENCEKRILRLGFAINLLASVLGLGCLAVSHYLFEDHLWVGVLIYILGLTTFIADWFWARMDRTTGFFQCEHCKHTYTPTKKSMRRALRGDLYKRYLRCPHCNQKGWHQRVYEKPED